VAKNIYLNLNEKPRIILQVMDKISQEALASRSSWNKGCAAVFLLLALGSPFFIIDLFMGYNVCTFSIIAALLWLAALALSIWLLRTGRAAVEKDKFDFARQVIYTLRDDVELKKGRITGWLDLTGAQQESKIARQGLTSSGRPKVYYRDPWLQFKTRLVDGNLLRLAIVENIKVKRGSVANRRLETKARLVVDPKAYEIRPFSAEEMRAEGLPAWQVNNLNGIIEVAGILDSRNLDARSLLHTLKWVYGHLQPRQAAPAQKLPTPAPGAS
jgi:hypothetical protein